MDTFTFPSILTEPLPPEAQKLLPHRGILIIKTDLMAGGQTYHPCSLPLNSNRFDKAGTLSDVSAVLTDQDHFGNCIDDFVAHLDAKDTHQYMCGLLHLLCRFIVDDASFIETNYLVEAICSRCPGCHQLCIVVEHDTSKPKGKDLEVKAFMSAVPTSIN